MHNVFRNIALSSVMAAALFASGCVTPEDVQRAQDTANGAQASANKAQATADQALQNAAAAHQTAYSAHSRINNMGTYGGRERKHHRHKNNGERA